MIEIARRANLPADKQAQRLLLSRLVTSAYLAVSWSLALLGDPQGARAAYQTALDFYFENAGTEARSRSTTFVPAQPGETFLAEVEHAKQLVDAELAASLTYA